MKIFNKLLAWILPYLPEFMVWFVAKNYIAGTERRDALECARRYNERGISATIDLLGEEVTDIRETDEVVREYFQILDEIKAQRLDATVSVKLSHLGLKIDKAVCLNNARFILAKAAVCGAGVCIDMEDHTTTTDTIDVYQRLRSVFGSRLSLALQAYLFRTKEDLQKLFRGGHTNIRICKGIYNEPTDIAFAGQRSIEGNYAQIVNIFINHKAGPQSKIAIATHNDFLIQEACKTIAFHNLCPDFYEFQMLHGVREELHDFFLNNKHPLRVYIPYGRHWRLYCLRRIKENPAMISHIIKSFLKSKNRS